MRSFFFCSEVICTDFHMPIFVPHGLLGEIFLWQSPKALLHKLSKKFWLQPNDKKNLCIFLIFFCNRQNIATNMVYYETLYRHVGYIKFCHKSLLSNTLFLFFSYPSKIKEKITLNKFCFIFPLIFEGYKKN